MNSPKKDVVERAIKDLNYHAKVLDSLGVGESHKIVLHIGGVYNDKSKAINRFYKNYSNLSNEVKQRLIIENDDKLYNINDVLGISNIINIPVVFDNLHNNVNPSNEKKSDCYWLNKYKMTWQKKDGSQKIHYSQQNPNKRPGSHYKTIRINEFL